MTEPLADIIIPVWNQAALTVKLLETIRDHTPEPFRVVLVDNGSHPAEFERVDAALRDLPHLLIRNTVNLGFVKAVNLGLAVARAPFVVLQNNDTEAVPTWLQKLLEPFQDPNVAAVGPRTTTPESWQGKAPAAPGWRILERNAMLAFFCTVLRREALEAVGPLDEDFGLGFGDDDDYCDRLHLAGYRLALRTDLVVPHHHRTTFRTVFQEEEIHRRQHEAMAKFRRKKEERRRNPPPAPRPPAPPPPPRPPSTACGGCGREVLVEDLARVRDGVGLCRTCADRGSG